MDTTPQMTWLSTNVCPNWGPTFMTQLGVCSPNSTTIYGYCTTCWDHDRVPPRWASQVREAERGTGRAEWA